MLAQPQPGVATIVYHSESSIAAAGAQATPDAPIGRLSLETTDRRDDRASLVLRTWPGGESRTLAKAGYHGAPVTWC